jgi:hypothetical protein
MDQAGHPFDRGQAFRQAQLLASQDRHRLDRPAVAGLHESGNVELPAVFIMNVSWRLWDAECRTVRQWPGCGA